MLKPKKKITKQEIERDPVLEKTVEFEQFIRHHAKNLMLGAGAIILIIVLSVFFVKSKESKNLAASGKLGMAQMALQRGDNEDAILRLEGVIEDFSGTESAGAATIMLGQLYLEKGDFDMAEQFYSDYANNYDNEISLSAAYKALGVCAENKGNLESAADYYKKAIKTAQYEFQKQMAQLSLVNINIKLKDYASANEIIDKLESSEPQFNVKSKLELLNSKLAVLEK